MKHGGIIFGCLLVLGGILFLAAPVHMQMTGLVLLLTGLSINVCMLSLRFRHAKTQGITDALSCLTAAAVILLIICMGLVSSGGFVYTANAGEQGTEYAVVLGAAVNRDGTPSRLLQYRIAAAYEYMETQASAVLILSGGCGNDEPISEAQCMYNTLVDMGADPERLILEQESHTTRENLVNSISMIRARNGNDQTFTVITSDFHILRSGYIANSLGASVVACPVNTNIWFYRINYTLREVFAFIKAFAQNYLYGN